MLERFTLRAVQLGAVLCAGLAVGVTDAHARAGCGEAKDSLSGPYDYRNMSPVIKRDVELNHFTLPVQQLRHGESLHGRGSVGRDLDYTLHVIPNHPQALLAMMRLSEKEKALKPRGALYPVACYFERALGWLPDDHGVRVLYGTYLAKIGEAQEAREHLALATQKAPNDANILYMAGLAYFDLKDFDQAREHAKRAYALGFSLPGLRRKLEAEGKWTG
jgi:tetratricopeptide (TPR) repeat protein